VTAVSVVKPSVLRSLSGDLATDVVGRSIERATRRGKFMLLDLSGQRVLAVNPMLTGAFQHCPTGQRVFKRTCLRLTLDDGFDLRYIDDRQMGIVYYVSRQELDRVPRLSEQGPDVLDGLSFDEFKERLRRFHGEIKGVLTRGRVIAGIGNAYADEVLYAAEVYPFRKRKALSEDELRRIHEESRRVVLDAMKILKGRMGQDIHLKIRDFLKVHNKGGEPCPRCGHAISQVTANRRITSYCRRCQPGMLLRN
jgi:formamidopyrimidine-DNA glycosylase